MQERASEWRATAEAAMVVRILTELAAEVSTKRFVHSRASRAERWAQLASVAEQQLSGLNALAKAPPKRAARPKVVTKEPGAPTPEEQAAQAEARADAAANR